MPRIDLSRYELSVGHRRVKLERQPMELLIYFAERHNQLVTRDDIVGKLWGKKAFVEIDGSINAAIRKIRSALRDDPSKPKYLETVVGKGYRLVGKIELVRSPVPPPLLLEGDGHQVARQPDRKARNAAIAAVGLIALLALTAWGFSRWKMSFATVSPRSIAVLPLTNLSGDPGQDYFAEGMTDEVTTYLATVNSLKVISRNSAVRYRASKKPVQQIAAELGVAALLDGSVVKSGDQIRVTARLIDASRDHYIWAEIYQRGVGDVVSVQSSIALEVARQVRIRLTASEQQRLERNTPINPDAYDAYLKGRYAQTTQSADALKQGLPAFQRAIVLDPTFAPAYAGLADTYSLLANYGVLGPSEAFPLAEAAARKAIELDANSAEAHTALGYPEQHYNWHWVAAEREYRTAIALSSSYSTAHLRYAEYLSSVARHEEAIGEIRRAIELDPLSPVYIGNLGRLLYHARRYDEAIDALRKTLMLDPNRTYSRLHLAMCYEQKAMYAEANKEFERVTADFGGTPGTGVAHFFATTGRLVEARQMVQILRNQASDSDWFFIAGVYAALKDNDAAFEALRKAYERHDFFLVFIKVHPYIDPLRSDPRYAQLIQRLGFP